MVGLNNNLEILSRISCSINSKAKTAYQTLHFQINTESPTPVTSYTSTQTFNDGHFLQNVRKPHQEPQYIIALNKVGGALTT